MTDGGYTTCLPYSFFSIKSIGQIGRNSRSGGIIMCFVVQCYLSCTQVWCLVRLVCAFFFMGLLWCSGHCGELIKVTAEAEALIVNLSDFLFCEHWRLWDCNSSVWPGIRIMSVVFLPFCMSAVHFSSHFYDFCWLLAMQERDTDI